jgi:hypothetical protein
MEPTVLKNYDSRIDRIRRVACALVASLSYYAIEKPFLDLRKKYN